MQDSRIIDAKAAEALLAKNVFSLSPHEVVNRSYLLTVMDMQIRILAKLENRSVSEVEDEAYRMSGKFLRLIIEQLSGDLKNP